MGHQLRARYIDLEIVPEDQAPEVYGPDVLIVRTKDGEKIPFDKSVLQATYIPVSDAGEVSIGGGVG